jgi:two-component system OmpR family response regulator
VGVKVLLIEDDPQQAQFIVAGFKQAGHMTDWAKDGMEGLYMAVEAAYDILVVDRMLPKLDGLSVVQTLRQNQHKTPVLFLSSLNHVDERVKGLRHGGDDYLGKPFEFSELLARTEALMRRGQPEGAALTTLVVADLELNLLSREVHRAGVFIELQSKEFQLLEYLVQRKEQVVTRTMLLEGVWGFHFSPNSSLIDAQISKLRSKIDKPFEKNLIKTIKGAGYKVSAKD